MTSQIISQRKLSTPYKISLIALFMALLCICSVLFAQPTKKQTQMAVFETTTGEHTVTLEVAKADNEKSIGLMYRTELGANAGMVFVYDTPSKIGIWMKNTFIPLDVIFINCDNIIADIVTRQPKTMDISYPSEKICSIIEVNAGFSEKISLKRGDKVNFIPSL